MRSHLSARSRLTLLYTSLFALGGAALILITYLLVAHTLHSTTTTTAIPQAIQEAIAQCVKERRPPGGVSAARVTQKCERTVCQRCPGRTPPHSAARRSAHLLTYALLGLAGVMLLAAVAGWIVAGRILRPVHRLTAAARAGQ